MKLKTQKKNIQEGGKKVKRSGWKIFKGQRRYFKGPMKSKYGKMYKGEGKEKEEAYQDYIEDNCADRTCKEHCTKQGLKNNERCIDKDRIVYDGSELQRGLCGSRNKDERKGCTPACDILSWTKKDREDGAETIKKMGKESNNKKSTVLRENDKLNLKYQLCNSSPKCYMNLRDKTNRAFLGNCSENQYKKPYGSDGKKMTKAAAKAKEISDRMKEEEKKLIKPCDGSGDNHCNIYNVDYFKKLYHILREDVKDRRKEGGKFKEDTENEIKEGEEILQIYKFNRNNGYNMKWWKTNVGIGNWEYGTSNSVLANVAEDNLTKVFTEYIINTVKDRDSEAFGKTKHIYSDETDTLTEDIKSAVNKVINLMGKMDKKPVSQCAEEISPLLERINIMERDAKKQNSSISVKKIKHQSKEKYTVRPGESVRERCNRFERDRNFDAIDSNNCNELKMKIHPTYAKIPLIKNTFFIRHSVVSKESPHPYALVINFGSGDKTYRINYRNSSNGENYIVADMAETYHDPFHIIQIIEDGSFTDTIIPSNSKTKMTYILPEYEVTDGNIGFKFEKKTDGNGVVIKDVKREGPAYKKGIRDGQVITHINDTDVTQKKAEYISNLNKTTLKKKAFRFIIADKKKEKKKKGKKENNTIQLSTENGRPLGMKLMKNTTTGKGAVIMAVDEGRQAEENKIKVGQIITHVNGTNVTEMTMNEIGVLIKSSNTPKFTIVDPPPTIVSNNIRIDNLKALVKSELIKKNLITLVTNNLKKNKK